MASINNGTGDVVIQKVKFDGSICNVEHPVTYDAFIEGYMPDHRELFEKADYPRDGPVSNPKWCEHEWKSHIIIGLGSLNQTVGDVSVLCRVKPSKAAFATAKCAANHLVLVPMTFNVKCEDGGPDDDTNNFICRGPFPSGKVMSLTPTPPKVPCPAWFVNSTDQVAKVNMEVRYRKLEVRVKSNGKTPEEYKFEVPVLVNKCVIKEGDELFVYRPIKKVASQKRGFVVVSGASSSDGAKAARLS